MSDPMTIAVLAVAMGFVCAGSLMWESARSRTLLDRWARRRGLQIVRREQRAWRTGPYLFRRGEGQVVFFATVVNAATGGNRRDAYVRVGGWWLGLLTDVVDIRWV